MSIQKPSIPKGTRDFSPLEMIRRNYIFDSIRHIFQIYGYQPIETPALENLSTLLGKYGDEGDRLIFKVLNSGDFLQPLQNTSINLQNFREIAPFITEKGLRYDLTVPFARYVVQNKNDIAFPFKRYQIQPVWRADRPQKGRYREFFQCDVDVIGSDSLLNEVELILIVDDVFTDLGINVTIRLNNRKILAGIAEVIGQPDRLTEITVAIDKLDKTGVEAVTAELIAKGVREEAISKLSPLFKLTGTAEEKFSFTADFLKNSNIGQKGLEELLYLLEYLKELNIRSRFDWDITLARGLNYYTGAIIEVKSNDVQIGSLCGGGRYDDLTGIFGLPGVSGVGISFGADRICDVMAELNLFPEKLESTTKVLFINFGSVEEKYCLPIISEFRKSGISAEIFPESAKMKKQLDYANKKNIPFVILIGDNEIKSGLLTLKDMRTGNQMSMDIEQIIKLLLM
jgi:histidyl-tRNA synthetase